MRIFYRISDNSYEKTRLPGLTKRICFENLLSVFGGNIFVIADNCSEDTLNYLNTNGFLSTNNSWISQGRSGICTNLGNSHSFRHVLRLATSLSPEEIVYFVEDDYLHKPLSPVLIQEGIEIGDYVTLYDHPDKYINYNEIYSNDISEVKRTKNSHWKYTKSTCLTFATRVKTLQADYNIWENFVSGTHPWDHFAFSKIRKTNKTVVSCIPGAAVHCDPILVQDLMSCNIDSWVLEHTKF